MNINNMNIYTCKTCSNIKRKITNNKKYGVDNISQSDIIKNKKMKTTLKNWGVENPSQSTYVKNKKSETMLENYGVEYVFQSDELRNNMKKTCLKKYGNENYNNRNDSIRTCLNKYGVKNISQSNDIKRKKYDTSLKNYGVEHPAILDEMKNKVRKTNLERYGVEYYTKTEEFENKRKLTCLKKYGVEYPLQNPEIFIKNKMSAAKFLKYKNTDIFYQGTYELDFLDKYYGVLNITKLSNYILYDKNKYYHPDFYLSDFNLIVEIKSEYTYNKELDKNLKKQKACLDMNYNFIFIINKNYNEFDQIISILRIQ
jgi:hypothetical protein